LLALKLIADIPKIAETGFLDFVTDLGIQASML
jgi:hypothetical protein